MDEKLKEIDSYCCSIKAMVGRPQQIKTVYGVTFV